MGSDGDSAFLIGSRPHPVARQPLYSPEQRRRRDESAWTVVQGVLAPLQFLVFLVSLWLVAAFLITGEGRMAAELSILLKTGVLLLIMVTGACWEKAVFGRWLFAPAFFWEDVVSMLVIALHAGYVIMLFARLGSVEQQMVLALTAYGTYRQRRRARTRDGARASRAHPCPARTLRD